MKILMISIIPPENEGRFHRAIEDLSKEHDVTILVPKTNLEMRNVKIFSLKTEVPEGFYSQLRYLFKILKQMSKLQQGSYDILYVSNYTGTIYAFFLQKMKKFKFVIYDAYELLVKTRKERITKRERIFLFFESKIVNIASLIIAANFNRALIMQGYYKLDCTPLVVNNKPTKVDIKLIDDLYKKKFSKKKDNIYIVYAGYVSNTRNIDKLVDAVGELGTGYVLNIYGNGPSLGNLKEHIMNKRYNNIFLHGKYSQEDLPKYLVDSDIGFLSYPNQGLNNIYCEPNKVNDYAQFLVPMISIPHSTLDKVLIEEGIGVTNTDLKIAIKEISCNLYNYISSCKKYNSRHLKNNQVNKLMSEIFKMENKSV